MGIFVKWNHVQKQIRRKDKKMNLNQCLTKRVKEINPAPWCDTNRIAILIWEKNDKDNLAADYCRKIEYEFSRELRCIEAENPDDAINKLQKEIEECQKNIKEEKMFAPKGFYVLGVGTTPDILANVPENMPECIVEYVRLINRNENEFKDALACYRREWLVRYDNTGAVLMLLSQAVFDERPLIPKGESRICLVKHKEYNADREEIVQSFLAVINKQLDIEEDYEEKLETGLKVEDQLELIMNDCIKPYRIPFSGYGMLNDITGIEEGKIKFKKWRQNRKQINQTKRTIGEVLGILQGKRGLKLQTEWVREYLVKDKIPKLCQKTLNAHKEIIKSEIEDTFTLKEISEKLSFMIVNYYQGIEASIEESNEEIEAELRKIVNFHNMDFTDVLEQLKEYYGKWEWYIKLCIEKTYWKCIANYVNELLKQYKKEYQELNAARRIFQEISIKEWDSGIEARLDLPKMKNMQQIKENLENYYNHTVFPYKNISDVRKEADYFYTTTDDYHATPKLRPYMYLYYPDNFTESEYYDHADHFEWTCRKVQYLPDNCIWELRIYEKA